MPSHALRPLVAQSLPAAAVDAWFGVPDASGVDGGGGGGGVGGAGGGFKVGDVVVAKGAQAKAQRFGVEGGGVLHAYEKAVVTFINTFGGDRYSIRRVRDGDTFGGDGFPPSELALAAPSSSSLSSPSSPSPSPAPAAPTVGGVVGSLLHLALRCHCRMPVIELLAGLHPDAAAVADAAGRLPLAVAIEVSVTGGVAMVVELADGSIDGFIWLSGGLVGRFGLVGWNPIVLVWGWKPTILTGPMLVLMYMTHRAALPGQTPVNGSRGAARKSQQ
jgi:hypothetical protein